MTSGTVSKIKMVVLDVDGTLTDGGIYILESGDQFRKFNAKDCRPTSRLPRAVLAIAGVIPQMMMRIADSEVGPEHIFDDRCAPSGALLPAELLACGHVACPPVSESASPLAHRRPACNGPPAAACGRRIDLEYAQMKSLLILRHADAILLCDSATLAEVALDSDHWSAIEPGSGALRLLLP